MEMLIMSRKVYVLESLKHKKITQQHAADQLNLSRRHINRIAKHTADGIEGIIHKGNGLVQEIEQKSFILKKNPRIRKNCL